MRSVTCAGCPHLRHGDFMGLAFAFCDFDGTGNGPIVPHDATLESGKRGDATLVTLWRVPLECPRPDSEVDKRTTKAKPSEWVTVRVEAGR